MWLCDERLQELSATKGGSLEMNLAGPVFLYLYEGFMWSVYKVL